MINRVIKNIQKLSPEIEPEIEPGIHLSFGPLSSSSCGASLHLCIDADRLVVPGFVLIQWGAKMAILRENMIINQWGTSGHLHFQIV